jgi:hypothetical protein
LSWYILSAEHGFLFPEDIVLENYNVTFNNKRSNPISVQDLRCQVKAKDLDRYDQIVVGPRQYSQALKDTFSGKEILTPLADCRGIGYMMGKLNEALKKGTRL